MVQQPKSLSFRGGPTLSVLPLVTFIVITVYLVINGAPAVEGMILAAMGGISVGMVFSRDAAEYSERVFSLMANRVATVAVVCWLWAGVFSGILANSGLVEAIVWVGWKLNLSGAWFTVAVFISSALFATSTGTGLRCSWLKSIHKDSACSGAPSESSSPSAGLAWETSGWPR